MKLFITTYIALLIPLFTQAQILLPIEVLGEEGKVVSRRIGIDQATANDATRLWLQVNNLGYENKGSIRINNGNWYKLNNSSVSMQHQEKQRGGMVHGGFNTIRFTIPITDLTTGENIIRFRFDESDGISMGYRVIRMNLLNDKGTQLLSSDSFEDDDPSKWTAPLPDPQSISEGEDLWRNGQLWANYLESGKKGKWYGYDLIGDRSTPINAKCADCHTQDGRDLEIFSYSNESIIERSKFHGMSNVDGEKIASYIRSLSAKYDNVERYGRPWNPPYQPGKELEGKPIEQWAAGAGLDAVLDTDEEMKEHIFKNGISQESMYEYFDSDEIENVTEIPLSIQMPDWKHWLPIIHPKDAYTKNNFYNDPSIQYNPQRAYNEMRSFFESNDVENLNINQIKSQMRNFWSNNRNFFVQGGSTTNHWRTPDGVATQNLANNVPRELAATSLARLMAVKFFEIHNEFNLQDKASTFIPETDQPSDRQWIGSHYQVFEVPAHFQACVEAEGARGACNNFIGQPLETGKFESTAWYHLQAIINPGMGQLGGTAPVDYNYHPRHILDASYTSGIEEPLRYFQSLNLMYQTRMGWSGDQGPTTNGFRMRNMGPWIAYGWDGNNRTGGYENSIFPTFLDNIEPGMSKWVMNAQLEQFLIEMRKPKNQLVDWPRTNVGDWDNYKIETAAITESDLDMIGIMDKNPFGHYVEKLYYVIPEYARMGVDCKIIEELIDWAQEAWPLINWDQFRGLSTPQVVLSLENNCNNHLEARSANTGNNPNFVWKVNNQTVNQNSYLLTDEYFEKDDLVEVEIFGVSSCATKFNPTVSSITIDSITKCSYPSPTDSAFFDFSETDFTQDIIDQWSNNNLKNQGATAIYDGMNNYAYFDGLDDQMSGVVNSFELVSPEITIESWVNLNMELGINQRIVTLNPSGTLLFRLNTIRELQIVVNSDVGNNNTRETFNSTTSITNNEWNHLAATLSLSELKIYINGELNSTHTLTAPLDFDGTGDNLQIVIGSTGATPKGNIDEIKIYNRVLKLSEIEESYNSSFFRLITSIAPTLKNKLTLFPNPTNHIVNVRGVEIASLELLSLTGNTLLSSNENSINIEAVSSGSYLLKVNTTAGEQIYERIVKE